MNNRIQIGCVFLASLLAANLANGSIMTADERNEKLDKIRALVSAEVVPIDDGMLANAPSPFDPDLGIDREVKAVAKTSQLSGIELLEKLSESMNPSGIFMFGGDYYLILGEKRLKTGSMHEVELSGEKYEVEITEITGANYSIRSGDAELQLKLK